VGDAVRARIQGEVATTTQNRFTKMAEANVREADGTVHQLGYTGAFVEIFKQANLDLEAPGRAAGGKAAVDLFKDMAAKLHIKITDADIARASSNTPTEFVRQVNGEWVRDNELRDPLAVSGIQVLDSHGNPTAEFDLLARRIEAIRATADNFQGLSDYMQIPAAFSTLGAAVTRGLGTPLADFTIAEWATAGRAGYNFDRLASRMSADFLDKAAQHYYFQAGADPEWLMWEQVRAGISLREEWWNSPDAPADIRADAELFANRLQAETGKYFLQATTDQAGNLPLVGGLLRLP
jgi:hypothetical protein